MNLAASLRVEGWKDWHLLTAVANIVVNARAIHLVLNMTTSITEADLKRFHSLMQEEEQADDPETPPELFTEDAMWFHSEMPRWRPPGDGDLRYALTFLDPRAFLRVLGDRLNYWADDVDHQPIFTN